MDLPAATVVGARSLLIDRARIGRWKVLSTLLDPDHRETRDPDADGRDDRERNQCSPVHEEPT
jgi:hypothetical protein